MTTCNPLFYSQSYISVSGTILANKYAAFDDLLHLLAPSPAILIDPHDQTQLNVQKVYPSTESGTLAYAKCPEICTPDCNLTD